MQLDRTQRISLELLLGQQRGDVAAIACFVRVMEAVRLTECERKEIKLRVEKDNIVWDIDPNNNPTVPVTLEDADRDRIVKAIETFDKFLPGDYAWVEPVLAALKNGNSPVLVPAVPRAPAQSKSQRGATA